MRWRNGRLGGTSDSEEEERARRSGRCADGGRGLGVGPSLVARKRAFPGSGRRPGSARRSMANARGEPGAGGFVV